MMKPVLDFAKQIVSLTSDVKQCKADILKLEQGQKEIRQELRDLTAVVQRLAFEQQRQNEKADMQREMMLKDMEIIVLRYSRGLPAPDKPQEDKPE